MENVKKVERNFVKIMKNNLTLYAFFIVIYLNSCCSVHIYRYRCGFFDLKFWCQLELVLFLKLHLFHLNQSVPKKRLLYTPIRVHFALVYLSSLQGFNIITLFSCFHFSFYFFSLNVFSSEMRWRNRKQEQHPNPHA